MLLGGLRRKRNLIIGILLVSQILISIDFQNSQAYSDVIYEDFTSDEFKDISRTNTSGWSGGISEVTLPRKRAELVSSYETSSYLDSFTIFGDIVYLCRGGYGALDIEVLNMSDPYNPQSVGALNILSNYISKIHIYGDYALAIGGYNELFILNITNPVQPSLVMGEIPFRGYVLEIDGDFIYTVDDRKLFLYNMTDIFHPKIISETSFPNTDGIFKIDLIRNILFIYGSPAYTLYIWDITDLDEPRLISTTTIYHTIVRLVISDNYCYLAGVYGGHYLTIFDISDLKNPIETSRTRFGNYILGLHVSDNIASLALMGGSFYLYDVSNKFKPSSLQNIGLPDTATQITVSGDYIFIKSSYNLNVIYYSDLISLNKVGSNTFFSSATSSFLVETLVYVTDRIEGLRILNMTDITQPENINHTFTRGEAEDVAIYKNFAYIADGSKGLSIINVTDPFNPSNTSFCDTAGTSLSIFVEGDLVYLADGSNGMVIVNVTNPLSPENVSIFPSTFSVQQVVVSGNVAFLANGYGGLNIVNISNPHNPIEISTYETPGFTSAISLVGDNVYIADGNSGIQIVNITDIYHPTNLTTFNYLGNISDLKIVGNYGYIISENTSLYILDMSNTFNLFIVDSLVVSTQISDLVVIGNFAYLADSNEGFEIIELRKVRNYLFKSYAIVTSDSFYLYLHYPDIDDITDFFLYSVIFTPDNYIPPGTSISYYVAGASSNWELVEPNTFHLLSHLEVNLRWMAELRTDEPTNSPIISSLSIAYRMRLNQPEQLEPSSEQITEEYRPVLSWDAIHSAHEYLVQIDDSILFDNLLVNSTVVQLPYIDYSYGLPTYSPDLDLPVGTLYWRVGAIDSGNDLGTFSTIHNITIIRDITNPTISSSTQHQFVQLDSVNNSLIWEADDSNPFSYEITKDGVFIDGAGWSSEQITYNIEVKVLGTYEYVCSVTDVEGQSNSFMITVEVVDTLPPQISGSSVVSFDETSTNNYLTWIASDNRPAFYLIEENNINILNETWLGNDIIYNVDHLPAGVHDVKCIVYDIFGNYQSFTTEVRAQDLIVPEINHLDYVSFRNRTLFSTSLEWEAYDSNPSHYEIEIAGFFYEEEIIATWDGSDFKIDFGYLPPDIYIISCQVYDTSSNSAEDLMVLDVKEPNIFSGWWGATILGVGSASLVSGSTYFLIKFLRKNNLIFWKK